MRKGMKLYYAAARDIADGYLYDCAFIASNDDVADKKARKYFNDCSYHYEFEIREQVINEFNKEDIESEMKNMKANEYYDAPCDYAWKMFV